MRDFLRHHTICAINYKQEITRRIEKVNLLIHKSDFDVVENIHAKCNDTTLLYQYVVINK